MKIRKGNISLILSLGIHFILLLFLSPFLVQQFNPNNDDLSLIIYRTGKINRIKRRMIHEHKYKGAIQNTDIGSTIVASVAPKYNPNLILPKAYFYDEFIPEFVTITNLSQTGTSPLSNISLGTDNNSVGTTVIPKYQRSGRSLRRSDRSSMGYEKESSIEKELSKLSNIDELDSIAIDKGMFEIGWFDSDVMPGHGLIGQLYVPNYPLYQMPNFEELTPIYTFATAKLDVSPRKFTSGFPTPKKQNVIENFAILFKAKLALHTPGVYTFELYSDDGAKLYIDGKLVVDNDGVHDPRNRRFSIKLAAGFHPIEIHYFQGPRYQIALQWFYTPPDRPRQIVPPEAIFHPEKTETPQLIRQLRNRFN